MWWKNGDRVRQLEKMRKKKGTEANNAQPVCFLNNFLCFALCFSPKILTKKPTVILLKDVNVHHMRKALKVANNLKYTHNLLYTYIILLKVT